MDADLSHNPKAIPKLVKKMREGYDVVVGSRYVKGGRIENWPNHRKIISKGANLLAKVSTGLKINDMTSGFRAYRLSILESLDLSEIQSDGYAFQVETLFHSKQVNSKITESPITFRGRKEGASKLGGQSIFEFFRILVEIFIERLKG